MTPCRPFLGARHTSTGPHYDFSHSSGTIWCTWINLTCWSPWVRGIPVHSWWTSCTWSFRSAAGSAPSCRGLTWWCGVCRGVGVLAWSSLFVGFSSIWPPLAMMWFGSWREDWTHGWAHRRKPDSNRLHCPSHNELHPSPDSSASCSARSVSYTSRV